MAGAGMFGSTSCNSTDVDDEGALKDDENRWVNHIAEEMTIEECAGQVLMPADRDASTQEWQELLTEIPLGSLFVDPRQATEARELIRAVQAKAKIPILIAADMEQGVDCATDFGYALALAAAGSEELVFTRSRALAREARALGIHWTFQPVLDLLINHNNPETNVRAFGSDPHAVARFIESAIHGLQDEGGFAATAKHFPGAGYDDRDQHLCTSINGLSREQWDLTYGHVWRAALAAGVHTVMTGHISMPDYDGLANEPSRALPATLNARLQVDFLRTELGFDGLIVSDAAPMIGITSRVDADNEVVSFLAAGGDVFLFADARQDHARIVAAVRDGRLRSDRLRDAARRVLALKWRLGLHRQRSEYVVDGASHASLAQELADKSITVVRANGAIARPVVPSERVLTVTLRLPGSDERRCPELEVVDDELRKRGVEVDHLLNPSHQTLREVVARYGRVFVNVVLLPHAQVGHCRMVGEVAMAFWRSFWVGHEHVVFTSFGSPYLLYEQPHWPNFVVAYGPGAAAQRAAVKVWLGELAASGKLPITLPLGLGERGAE